MLWLVVLSNYQSNYKLLEEHCQVPDGCEIAGKIASSTRAGLNARDILGKWAGIAHTLHNCLVTLLAGNIQPLTIRAIGIY